MRYQSTRNTRGRSATGFSAAIAQGLAPDGGLFVPDALPSMHVDDFKSVTDAADIACHLLAPFVAADPLAEHLDSICRDCFDFPLPVTAIHADNRLSVLELFHGPTAAFKDIGAGFLSACSACSDTHTVRRTLLVATSGDTGAAVAAAFCDRDDIDVVILYPDGQVSPRQAHQLACWGSNVRTYAVDGSFDDCQRMVKGAFGDPAINSGVRLCSANSINIGRLLPQMVYYVSASLAHFGASGEQPGFIIPSGNLGNAFACLMARRLGFPIGDVVIATNANRPVTDFLETGCWEPRQSIRTLASAMDVGDPSNMERLRWLYPDVGELCRSVTAVSVTDEAISQAIRRGYERYETFWCPHTATAYHAWSELSNDQKEGAWIIVATAHAAKFDTIVEPLTGATVPVPETLSRLMDRAASVSPLAADPGALRNVLLDT